MVFILKQLETELKLRGFSEKTVKSYIRHNQLFLNYIKKQPEEVLEEDIKTYMAYLITDKNIAPRTFALKKSALKLL